MLNLLILYPLELFAFLALFYEKSCLTTKNEESKNKPERKAPNDHHTYANYVNKNYEANMLNSDKMLRCHIIATPIKYLQKQCPDYRCQNWSLKIPTDTFVGISFIEELPCANFCTLNRRISIFCFRL